MASSAEPTPPKALPAAYRAAWERLVADLAADPAVLGATISGSVLRGEGGPTSDLDVYVLIRGDERWRRTYLCEGVLVEEFRNAEPWVRVALAGEDVPALHMLGFGVAVVEREPLFRHLRLEARRVYAAGPRALDDLEATYERYLVWDGWCDVKDLLAQDADVQAVGLMQSHIGRALQAHHRLQRHWMPKMKNLLASLRDWDGPLAAEVGAFWGLSGRDSAAAFARFDAIARRVLAPHDPDQPLLWESPPQRWSGAPPGRP